MAPKIMAAAGAAKAKAKAKVRARAPIYHTIIPRLYRVPRVLLLIEAEGWASAERTRNSRSASTIAAWLIQCGAEEFKRWVALLWTSLPRPFFATVKLQYDRYAERMRGGIEASKRGPLPGAAWAVMPCGVVAGPRT